MKIGRIIIQALIIIALISQAAAVTGIEARASSVENWTDTYGMSMAVDAQDNLYMAGYWSGDVKVIYTNGSVATIVRGLQFPCDVAVDAHGNVYTLDGIDRMCLKAFYANGSSATLYTSDALLYAVTVDAGGDIYVAQRNQVVKMCADGSTVTFGGFACVGDLAVDAQGNVYVTDYYNNDVRKILADGSMVTVGSGFNHPTGVAVNMAGNVNVYVADCGNNAVKVIRPDGSVDTLIGGISSPYDVEVDSSGHLYVTQFNPSMGKYDIGIIPVAGFSADVTEGFAPLTVRFADESANATAWQWDFDGDGIADSTEQNPVHAYVTPGQHTVSLTVSNDAGSDTEIKTGYVTVYAVPGISVSPTVLSASAGASQAYEIRIDSLPYGLSGYALNVSLDSPEKAEIVDVSYPAWASLNDTLGVAGDTVRISAIDLNRAIEPGADSVVLATVTVRGDMPGTTGLCLVDLRLEDEEGQPISPAVANGRLNVYTGLSAEFSATPISGAEPLAVQFTDLTTGTPGPASWQWSFGDGNTSTMPNPSHTYLVPGTYTIALTVTNEYGTDTMTKANLITVRLRVQAFPGYTAPPTDPDGDGLYEDINGNGRLDFDDIVALYQNLEWAQDNPDGGPGPYDYNGNGRIDFDDIVTLYLERLG